MVGCFAGWCGLRLSSRDHELVLRRKIMVKNNLKGKVNKVTFCPTLAGVHHTIFITQEGCVILCLRLQMIHTILTITICFSCTRFSSGNLRQNNVVIAC